jgi:hypothetical protein
MGAAEVVTAVLMTAAAVVGTVMEAGNGRSGYSYALHHR